MNRMWQIFLEYVVYSQIDFETSFAIATVSVIKALYRGFFYKSNTARYLTAQWSI